MCLTDRLLKRKDKVRRGSISDLEEQTGCWDTAKAYWRIFYQTQIQKGVNPLWRLVQLRFSSLEQLFAPEWIAPIDLTERYQAVKIHTTGPDHITRVMTFTLASVFPLRSSINWVAANFGSGIAGFFMQWRPHSLPEWSLSPSHHMTPIPLSGISNSFHLH